MRDALKPNLIIGGFGETPLAGDGRDGEDDIEVKGLKLIIGLKGIDGGGGGTSGGGRDSVRGEVGGVVAFVVT